MPDTAILRREQVDTGTFLLTTYYCITRLDLPLSVYIESDDITWSSRTTPSQNPTPQKTWGLALAAADLSPNIVYLARPCQFTLLDLDPTCNVAYWTDKRYAEDVIVVINRVVTHYIARLSNQRINLIGYSGGGAIAVLIAARRTDVISLRTMASNLNTAEVNYQHHVTTNAQFAQSNKLVPLVVNIPQIHFIGAEDTIISPVIAQHFAAKVGHCAQSNVITGMAHESNWLDTLPNLLRVLQLNISIKHK